MSRQRLQLRAVQLQRYCRGFGLGKGRFGPCDGVHPSVCNVISLGHNTAVN